MGATPSDTTGWPQFTPATRVTPATRADFGVAYEDELCLVGVTPSNELKDPRAGYFFRTSLTAGPLNRRSFGLSQRHATLEGHHSRCDSLACALARRGCISAAVPADAASTDSVSTVFLVLRFVRNVRWLAVSVADGFVLGVVWHGFDWSFFFGARRAARDSYTGFEFVEASCFISVSPSCVCCERRLQRLHACQRFELAWLPISCEIGSHCPKVVDVEVGVLSLAVPTSGRWPPLHVAGHSGAVLHAFGCSPALSQQGEGKAARWLVASAHASRRPNRGACAGYRFCL